VTYEGVLAVDNADRALRPGMTATATIVADTKRDVLLVPNAALRFAPKPKAGEKPAAPTADKPGERRVWILEGATPKALSVKVGATDGRMTELPGSELKVGDAVIVDTIVKD
jgi:HlyD family secretion protein